MQVRAKCETKSQTMLHQCRSHRSSTAHGKSAKTVSTAPDVVQVTDQARRFHEVRASQQKCALERGAPTPVLNWARLNENS